MADDSSDGWWSRNWKRAIPLGCLGLMLLGAGLVAIIIWSIKQSGPFEGAMDLARANCAVERALGTSLEAGWLVSGSVNVSGPSGDAALSFPISGSRGSGRLHVVAHKQTGRWEFEALQLKTEGGDEFIDLLVPRNERCEPQQAPKTPWSDSPPAVKGAGI